MSPCLVQQLFRQKIGEELDQHIVEEVLFPMLRCKKHPSKELLQDIKLTSGILITTQYKRTPTTPAYRAGPTPKRHFSVPTFTPIPEYWAYSQAYPPVGKRTSKVRRAKIPNEYWGTIDILNELRGLNYPQVGYKAAPYIIEEPDSFNDAYIKLAEDNANIRRHLRHGACRYNADLIDSRSQFVNNFLDDILITDKRLTWSGSTPWGILSMVESSQYGEVQKSQLY
jgi:hypothetical protein